MHEGNTFCYDPVLSMARSDSPMNLPLLDETFALLIQSDPNLQEVAVTTTDNTTTPTTPPSHFDNDLANLSLPSTPVKSNNFLYDSIKTNDTQFLCLINKGEVEAKIEQFSDNPVRPSATITKPLEFLHESATSIFSTTPNNNFLNQTSNEKESQSELNYNPNTRTMTLNDINDLLLDPNNSKPNPRPDGNHIKPAKCFDDSPVPSTSGCFVTQPQKTDRCSRGRGRATTKNAIAARENRVKKKCYVEDLEKSVKVLQDENRDLAQRLESVTSKYEKRGSEIEYLKSVLVNDGKLYNILKNVPHIKSVGSPLFKSAGKGPPCVGGMSPPVKTETRGTRNNNINNKNHKNISENNNPLPSSSFSSPSTSNHCSLQLRNINIMKDSPVGDLDKGPQKKDPSLRGSSNCQVDKTEQSGMGKDLRKTLSGRVTKNEFHKCISTWGSKKFKKNVTKSTDPTS